MSEFDKEHAIAEWRSRLGATGSLFEGDLDELESHLRDELDALEEVDLRGRAAFEHAEKRLGDVTALGLEFAKVNPLLVWRTALFWISTGTFLTLVGAPLWDLAIHGVMDASLALNLPIWAVKAGMYFAVIGIPLILFAGLFSWMSSRIGKPFAPLKSPIFRVLLLVFGAASMLFGHLHGYVIEHAEFRKWGSMTAYFVAHGTSAYAQYLLGFIAPVVAAAGAILLRRRAVRLSRVDAIITASEVDAFRAREAPMFWLAIGCFIAIVRMELSTVVRGFTVLFGGALHFGVEQMSVLVWLAAFACPMFIALSAWTFLRFRAPSPHAFMKSHRLLFAILGGCAAAIGSMLLMDPAWTTARSLVDLPTFLEAFKAWNMANIFTALIIPVAVGTVMLRLERSAHGSLVKT